MSWKDDLAKKALELDRLFKPLHELEVKNAYQSIADEQKRLEHQAKDAIVNVSSTYGAAIEAIEKSLERQNHLKYHSRAMDQLTGAHGALAQYLASQDKFDVFQQAQRSMTFGWRDQIAAYQGPGPLQQYAAELALKSHSSSIAEVALLAQERLNRVPWTLDGTKVFLAGYLPEARASFTTLAERYRDLISSFLQQEDFMTSFPPIVSGGPPVEIYTNVRALDALSGQRHQEEDSGFELEVSGNIDDEIEASLEALLSEMKPGVSVMLRGARDALGSGNPDRGRHVTVSLRELFSHVLHTIAPDKEVKEWVTDPNHLKDGRPTRAARVLYVCRGINHGPFTQFVASDVKASIDLIDLFQRGTHEVASVYSDYQLRTLVIRTESALRFLLLTWRALGR